MKVLSVLELFAGSCSFSNVAKEYGCNTITTDFKQYGDIDIVCDILDFDYFDLPPIDIVWASPPCTYFSVASIGKHWNRDNTPKTKQARESLELVKKTIEIIDYLGPTYWIIENPRGKLRKLDILKDLPRYTVTYCQYGDNRMKPTDIWTNIPWTPRPMCKNGMPCHESAPRGSMLGTQSYGRNKYESSKVPYELCNELMIEISNGIF